MPTNHGYYKATSFTGSTGLCLSAHVVMNQTSSEARAFVGPTTLCVSAHMFMNQASSEANLLSDQRATKLRARVHASPMP